MKEIIGWRSTMGHLPATGKNLITRLSPLAARLKLWLPVLLSGVLCGSAWGQAPGLMWSTNAGATVIGVDAQTNLYAEANTGTGIVKLTYAGEVLLTNLMNPFPAYAGNDAAGNFYFASTISGTQNFGGGIFVSNSSCAIAKYDNSGNILWARGFGPGGTTEYLNVSDLKVDPSGVAYASYAYAYDEAQFVSAAVGRFDDSTSVQTGLPLVTDNYETYGLQARLGAVSPTNGYALTYYKGFYGIYVSLVQFTNNGATGLTNWTYGGSGATMPSFQSPFADSSGNLYNVEVQKLTKRTASGTLIWSVSVANQTFRCVAGDFYGGVHVADNNGVLARYDSAGNLAWSTNLPVRCSAMICDTQGNRFISLTNGTVARLQAESVSNPVITNAPLGGEVFAGSNFTFSVGASGFTPFNYYWLYQSNSMAATAPVSGASNATLTLSNLTASQTGLYSVIVSNAAGSVTSAPVTLVVKAVELFNGSQMLTNGAYFFSTPPSLTIRSAFTNGSEFYTLDGSTPSFASTPYSGPFTVSSNATVNAIGYNADFSQSALADTVAITVPPQYSLAVSTLGGGTISLSPPGGTYTGTNLIYPSNTVVSATANPATGWSFLYWQGASSASSPAINVTMNQNQSLTAVFGTTLGTTVVGNGQVLLTPPGGVYAFGATVRLEALPQPGNFFGAWGNAASGNTNPLYFTVTNPTPTVSSIFGATSSNQAALTVLVLGQGQVSFSPTGNVFATNQSVVITATPNAGQSFLGWSGGASGTANPLTVVMTQPRVIMAHFSGQSVSLQSASLGSQGFHFSLGGDPGAIYQIFDSSNLVTWQSLGLVTNSSGVMTFTDPAAANAPMRYYQATLTP